MTSSNAGELNIFLAIISTGQTPPIRLVSEDAVLSRGRGGGTGHGGGFGAEEATGDLSTS